MYPLIDKTRVMENLYSWSCYVNLNIHTNLIDGTEAE